MDLHRFMQKLSVFKKCLTAESYISIYLLLVETVKTVSLPRTMKTQFCPQADHHSFSHMSSMALWMVMLTCWSNTSMQTEISQLFNYSKFGTDIQGPQRMNHNDFGEPLPFPPAPKAGQTYHLSSDIPKHVPD